ncbi:CHAD domain-containing protein [Streptomyces sp. NPDC002172]
MTDTSDGARSVGRRTVLVATGTTAAALAVGAAVSTEAPAAAAAPDLRPAAAAAVCTLTEEQTQGPYYLDGALVRSNITEGKSGITLNLALTVVDSACTVIPNALVEVWHADALGEYSGYVGANGHSETDDGTFLRGGVLTNSSGVANITTIYPGWYRGRCVHIHVKVHTGVTLTSDGSFTGGSTLHTGQLFINETITTAVAKVSPYSTNTVTRTTLAQDGIYDDGGASSGLMTVTGSTSAGYTGMDTEEGVHDMRVATRRLRSTFRSFGKVLDRQVTDPIADELKWLAGELGVGRDQEVLAERLMSALADVPPTLVHGPVHDRIQRWAEASERGSRSRLLGVLDSTRYLALLDTLDTLAADPPLLKAAAKDSEKVLTKAVHKDFAKVTDLIETAMAEPPGHDRDLGLHEARKKAKRTRYAAEAARPALGKPAKTMVKSMKSLQTMLGEHQDSVMARETLRELSAVAHAAGESAFTYGLLYGREEQRAAAVETEAPGAWEDIKAGAPV